MTNRDKLLKKNGLQGMEIDLEVSKDHPFNDEIAIIRKAVYAIGHELEIRFGGNPLPTEFIQYYREVEQKKAQIKANLGL